MKNANEANTENKNMENNCNQINESEICENIIKSKDIICQKCAENVFLNIKDYKIKLYECKNNHIIENLLINEFEKCLNIDTSKITCQNCNKNDRSKTNNKDFYICLTCKKNLCPECKIFHDKKHKIIKYDFKNYICPEHNMHYIRFCNQCKINICLKCEKSHKNHKNLIYFGEILVNDDDLLTEMNEFDDYISKFNDQIEGIIQKLEIVKKNFEIYSKLVKHIYNNYDCENINYQKIQNLNEIKNFNEIIKNDIKSIIKDENIKNKFYNIIEIYNKMNNKTISDYKQKNLIEKINEIKILSKEKEDSIDHRKKEKNKNIVSQIYSVKIIGKIKEGNKIVSNYKLEILAGKKNKDNISKKNKIESNPRYLKYKDGINIGESLVLLFISKKDNNLYFVSSHYTNSNFRYSYKINKIDLKSKLTKKLITSISLDYDIHYQLNYFFNDKNNNEYLMNCCNDPYLSSFIGIIIIDITNNYKINNKINLYKTNYKFWIATSLLVFPQNNNNNYIIFECYDTDRRNQSLNHNKLYSLDDGKFIKNINTFPEETSKLISWYNRKDKNNYIIQQNSEGTIIFNLFEDIFDVLTSSILANNNIYNINDLDCLLCHNRRDYGIIEIWNLYSKQLFKTIKINTSDLIQWNDKYLIHRSGNDGAFGIFDIENEISSQICLKQNQSSGERLPTIYEFKKIIDPKQGECLIAISHDSNNYFINLLSIK